MGFVKEIIKEAPSGAKQVQRGNHVVVHCTGLGKDRDLTKKFWSTKDVGQKAFAFDIGQGNVIKGWDEGVLTMKVGEVALIKCTSDYAYGAGGFPAWG
jgi:peptidylprolyl isomerase